MARSGYLKIEGESAGTVAGSVKQKGHEDWIEVIALEHNVIVPVDNQSGQIYGRRQHKPFIITKALDKATPLLFQIMGRGENIKTAVLDFMKVSAKGGEEILFTYTLEDAKIIQIESIMANVKDPQLDNLPNMEKIYLAYRKISWKFADGNLESSDDWQDRVG